MAGGTNSITKRDWQWLVPLALIFGWWVYDLQVQWRMLVEYQYGWLVLMLAVYLGWERWPTRPQTDRPAPLWAGIGLALAGTPFVLVAELYKQAIANSPAASFALSIGCFLFITALISQSCGWATWRHFLFPLIFFFVAVPLPKVLWNPIVFGLQNLITIANVELLNLIGIPAVQQAHVIQLPKCVVGVDEACSGVRSLQSSIMVAFFIGDLTLKRWGAKVAFLLAGIVLAMVGNFFRSFYLSLTAHHKGIEALEGVHDAAGWSILIFTAVGLILLGWSIVRLESWAVRVTKSRETDEVKEPVGAPPASN